MKFTKEISKKQMKTEKPYKCSSLPDIHSDNLPIKLSCSNLKRKDILESELKFALSITSNSSEIKCEGDERTEIRSPPTPYNNQNVFYRTKNADYHNTSNLDFFKKIHEEKPTQIKIIEELANVKHINEKQKNEIKLLNQKIHTLKNIIKMNKNEIQMLNKNYREIIDKFECDSQSYRKLNAEFYLLQEALKKIKKTFKSTLNILVDIIDTVVISPCTSFNKLMLHNNNALFNTTQTISFMKNEEIKNNSINEIKGILISNLNYISKSANINLDKELQKIMSWEINLKSSSLKNISIKNLDIISEDCNLDLDNFVSTQLCLSPRFSNEKDTISDMEKSSSFHFMSNFNGSLKDLEIVETKNESNVDKENDEKNSSGERNYFHFNHLNVDFNDNITDFNIEIINNDDDKHPIGNKETNINDKD